MRLRKLLLAIPLAALPMAAAAFELSFEWGDIPLCTSGSPNRVDNPEFQVSGLPEGTRFVAFTLKDLDVPHYRHGGGIVEMTGNGTVPSGAFRYKSPCPPNGAHTYEWRATARASQNGDPLGEARAQRRYPE